MKEYNVLHYGAVGDGRTDDAKAIQAAIDACEQDGGGRVTLESGRTYYSASLRLKRNVELYIQKGAVLKATSTLEDYIRPNLLINDPKTALIGNPVTGKPSFVFLYAYDAPGASIAGEGVIDANGHAFLKRKDRYYVTADFYPRPTVIYFEKSDHISFRDFTVIDAPFWTLHPAGCDDVLIDAIRILNDLDVANSDGIDPDHCSNVRIRGCHITCADDLINAMRWESKKSNKPTAELEMFPSLNAEEQKVVDIIRQAGDIHINTLAERAGMPVYRIMSTVVELDCRGIIITLPGCRYTMA